MVGPRTTGLHATVGVSLNLMTLSGVARWNLRAALAIVVAGARALSAQKVDAAADTKPLPDIPALMRAVEANEHTEEDVVRQYLYRSVRTFRHADGHGGVKRTEVAEFEVFWVGDVAVERLVRKDGRDLTQDEQRKEEARVDKEAARARERRERATADGKETDPRGHDVVTVSRLLELGRFTNARRVMIDGRPSIAVDFAGDPAAKTRTRFEEVIRDMEGTVWIDEQDKILRRAEGHFLRPFKVGGGLVADIRQGTSFRFEQRKVNDEVWLPATADATGAMRVMLLFHFDGSGSVVNSGYKKFRATSTILPGVSKIEDTPASQGTSGP